VSAGDSDEVYVEKINGRIVISMKEKRETFKAALDDMFGCCPDFTTSRDRINDDL